MDATFVLQTLVESAKAEKKPLYVAFIDFKKAYDYVMRDGLFYKMLQGNMLGPVYRVIHSMYQSVKSVVRCGAEVSQVLHQHVGLRQGCVFFPCLFSLYIADLPAFLREQGCSGVKLYDIVLQVLLYADDGAIVASSEAELQRALDALSLYCSRWRLIVNTDKTKVMVVNPPREGQHHFAYDGQRLEIILTFKYLGLLLDDKGNYATTAKHRLTQGKRLVAAWLRRSEIWSMDPATMVTQFQTCVMPALEYGVSIWGAGQYNSNVWEQIEVFWRSIAKTVLGVSVRAPNVGVSGELGWLPFRHRAIQQATAFFTRVTEMPDDALVRKAMQVQRALLASEATCWLSAYKHAVCSTEFGMHMWNTWFATHDFRCVCSRENVDVNGRRLGAPIRWEQDVGFFVEQQLHDEWKLALMRVEAQKGEGLNKLRTYRLFKTEWGRELYLDVVKKRDQRALLTKFRIGISPLRIETGRYENVGRSKGVPACERVCLVCNSDVCIEDEYHFLMECSAYSMVRTELFDLIRVSGSEIDIDSENREALFINIMSTANESIIQGVALFVMKAFKIRERILLTG